MELVRIVRCDLVQRNQPSTATTLDRRGITALVRHEMLERREKKRTQPALFLTHGLEILAVQNQREKPLRDILRLVSATTLSPHESVNGPPISAAKILQRLLGCRRFTSRRRHYA